MMTKSSQLQIRVTVEQKTLLKQRAAAAGQDVSSYVLTRALPEIAARFDAITAALADAEDHRFPLAELNDLLTGATGDIADSFSAVPKALPKLSPFLANYVAAMVEQAAQQNGSRAPAWVCEVPPLERPYFATDLAGLRLHLLRSAPVPFKRRNLFVDASLGSRV